MSFERNTAPATSSGERALAVAARGPAVYLDNVGKRYCLFAHHRDRLKQLIVGRWRRYYREVWAVRGVNLEVPRGRTVGILGPNGSGKSTLLQIIAGTLTPSEGRVRTAGRVAALLELGSGFHPEFTGRENVLLYGTILGLTGAEIADRFDAIAAFADIGPYLDSPLKTYSSGMAMRLAFAVASHIDPDVLLVDEALAVGDLRFQQRCLARLRHLRDDGKTIVLVTHDLDAAKRLCDQLYVLDKGRLLRSGAPDAVVNWYFGHMTDAKEAQALAPSALVPSPVHEFQPHRHGDGKGRVAEVQLLTEDGRPAHVTRMDGKYRLRFVLTFSATVATPVLGFYVRDRLGTDVIGVNTHEENRPLPSVECGDQLTVDFVLPLRLRPGHYSISPGLAHGPHETCYLDWWDNALVFEIVDAVPGRSVYGLVHPEVRVEISRHPSIEEASHVAA